jgi:hypothetical protein
MSRLSGSVALPEGKLSLATRTPRANDATEKDEELMRHSGRRPIALRACPTGAAVLFVAAAMSCTTTSIIYVGGDAQADAQAVVDGTSPLDAHAGPTANADASATGDADAGPASDADAGPTGDATLDAEADVALVESGGDAAGGSADASVDAVYDASADGDAAVSTCGGFGQACCLAYVCNSGLECTSLGNSASTCECLAGNCSAVLLASQVRADFLAVDSSYVYWSGSSGIGRVALGGGPAQMLFGASSQGIAVDATSVYFASAADVFSMPLTGVPDGGAPSNLGMVAAGTSTPAALSVAVDSSGVYANCYTTGLGEPISKFPLTGLPDGGAPLVLGGGPSHLPSRIVLDSAHVYWSSTNATMAAPLGGGATFQLGTVANSFYLSQPILVPLAVDASYVYTSDGTNIVRMPKSFGDAGAAVVIASAQPGHSVTALAVNATQLFWADETGGLTTNDFIYVVPLDGSSAPSVIASFGNGVDEPIWDMVLDATHVYWTTLSRIFALPL